MAYDPFGSGDLGASPFDDIFARFFGGAAPQRPAQRIDIGQLIIDVGIAPVKPAEFVVFRIAQFAGGAAVSE